jgi:hypothetical protein
MQIKAYQIYYDHAQEGSLNPLLIPYYNPPVFSLCLENHVISELILTDAHKDCDYFGVFSWKFEKKHGRTLARVLPLVDDPSVDVYSFFSIHTKPNMWSVAERWHKGVVELAQEIFNRIGKPEIAEKLTRIQTPTVYQNAFLARPELYEQYVKDWLVPFMETMKADDLRERLFIDSKYKTDVKKAQLMSVFGVPYYPLHPFLCERLFSTFLSQTNYKVKHIA